MSRAMCELVAKVEAPSAQQHVMVKARLFANARASAGARNLGPENGFRERWFPRLAGRWVRYGADPDMGFESRNHAINAARQYREECRAMLRARMLRELIASPGGMSRLWTRFGSESFDHDPDLIGRRIIGPLTPPGAEEMQDG